MNAAALFITRLALILASAVISTRAYAETYYISPAGSDSNTCSRRSPCLTFSKILPLLGPGDALILKNGTYNRSSRTGFPGVIDCSSTHNNGTASQPITIKAENERQAWVKGSGTAERFKMRKCSWWRIEGIRWSNADAATNVNRPVEIRGSANIVWRRNLHHHNNRWANESLFTLRNTHNSLVEENEGYFHHRNGFTMGGGSSGNTIRRNYVNPRGYADLPTSARAVGDGFPYKSGITSTGDESFNAYPGSNNIFENNIADSPGQGFVVNASSTAVGNKFFGNICFNALVNCHKQTSRGGSLRKMPRDNHFKNLVAVGTRGVGFYAVSAKNARCDNCTILNGGSDGIQAIKSARVPGNGDPTFFSDNTLSSGNSGLGIRMIDQSDFLIDFANSFGNGRNFSSMATNQKVTNESTIDPRLGKCLVFIPDGSPMKGAGKGGADIGANVLYRYENGVLTSRPLWNPGSGAFTGCGAIVAGVNDVPGSSCFDVHKRLNVNTNGCSLPDGYGQ